MSKPTVPSVQDRAPLQPPSAVGDPDSDFDDRLNQEMLGRPLGFIPLYMLPSSIMKQKVRHQQPGFERRMQPRERQFDQERFESPISREGDADFDEQRSGKSLIDASNIHLPSGHPPVPLDELMTGTSQTMEESKNRELDPKSSDSPIINPPEINEGKMDINPEQMSGKTLIDPESIHLPAGHPPVSVDDLTGSRQEPLEGTDTMLTKQPNGRSEPFEFPAQGQIQSSDREDLSRSLNQDQLGLPGHPLSDKDVPELPRAMPRRKRDHQYVEHHIDLSRRPYYDGEYDYDQYGQRPYYPGDQWNEDYDTSETVRVYHH